MLCCSSADRGALRRVRSRTSGCCLYFCLADLALVEPMYQFSLEWFTTLFRTALKSTRKQHNEEEADDSDEEERGEGWEGAQRKRGHAVRWCYAPCLRTTQSTGMYVLAHQRSPHTRHRHPPIVYAVTQTETSITERLSILMEACTLAVYQHVCRSLFEKDKLLFSFLMTVRLAEAEQGLDHALVR